MRRDAASERKEQGGSQRRDAVESVRLIERFIQVGIPSEQRSCRRVVLNEYFDGEVRPDLGTTSAKVGQGPVH
jgi:hypothetical protein